MPKPDDKKPRRRKRDADEPVSLAPLEFEEAVSDLLKVKPKDKKGTGKKRSPRKKP